MAHLDPQISVTLFHPGLPTLEPLLEQCVSSKGPVMVG